jgi:Mrp family chromosome partitioning ATPase
MGQRVLLIDADFGRRDAVGAPGLTDLLVEGVAALPAAVRPTAHERVFALPVGSPDLTAASLAAGRHGELIERVCAAYDSVIVMGAPVLRDTKWLMLAPLVDHSLLLAMEGRTHVSDLDTSLRVLSECKAAGVGVVLTREQRRPHPAGSRAPALLGGARPAAVGEPALSGRTDS